MIPAATRLGFACLVGLAPVGGLASVSIVGGSDEATLDGSGDGDVLDDLDEWETLLHALDVLATGTSEEKLDLFGPDDDPFYALDEPPDGDPRATEQVVARLHHLLLTEPDPFVAWRVASSLADWGYAEAAPIFRDLEMSSVPSLRHAAALGAVRLGVAEHPPEAVAVLLRLWRDEEAPWLRAELLGYLSEIEGTAVERDCLDLVSDDDEVLAAAAMECLVERDPPGALDALVARMRKGPRLLAQLASSAIVDLAFSPGDPGELRATIEAEWPPLGDPFVQARILSALDAAGSPLAVPAALDVLWHDDPLVASAAVDVLGRESSEPSRLALFDRAVAGPPPVRARAISALRGVAPLGEMEVLLADALAPGEPVEVQLAAINVIGRIAPPCSFRLLRDRSGRLVVQHNCADDPRRAFLPFLGDLASSDSGGKVPRSAASTIEAIERGEVFGDGGCTIGRDVGVPFVVVDVETARCFRRPHVGYEPEAAVRPPRERFLPGPPFDDGTSRWFLVPAEGESDCWLPAESVSPATTVTAPD